MAHVIKVKHADTLRRLTFEKPPGEEGGVSFADLESLIRVLFQIPASSAQLKVTYTDKENDVVTMESDQDLKDACVFQALNPLRLNVVVVPEASSSRPFEGMDLPLKDLLMKLHPENMKNILQNCEPLLKDVRSATQIPELLEQIYKTVLSHIPMGGRNGGTATPTPPSCPPSQGNQSSPPQHSPPRPWYYGEEGAAESQNGAVHFDVCCDGCGMHPITGTRYKSQVRDNYDLCSSCFAKSGETEESYVIFYRAPFRPRHFRFPRNGRMNMCPAMGPVGGGMGPIGHGGMGHFGPLGPGGHGGMGPFGHVGPHGRGGMSRGPHCGVRTPQDYQGGRLDARFVCDVSVFDGTELAPGTRFTKIWRLRNSGTAPWPSQTKLVNVDGDDLGSATITPLQIGERGLAPEEEIEVSVDCVAPQQIGRYQSSWRLSTPWGPKFGHKIWVQIQVVSADTLNQPARVDVGENAEQEAAIPAAEPAKFSNAELPEVAESESTAEDMVVATETTEGIESMKSIEESFVKVDVNNNGDESPHIQMIEMPSGLVEEEKTEAPTAPTVEPAAAEETGPVDNVSNGLSENITTEVSSPVPVEEVVKGKAPVDTEEDAMASFNPLLGRLEAMGFSDRELNLELLKANAFDLRKSVDALCAVDDWAPAFAELEEMGFTDAGVNRRLMFKNQGNLKRVVKELVQLAKEASGRAKNMALSG
ncbi:hypothetical protein Mapa_015633 [Marchantia paleacea]|nr:hypothetical protein Mapa_015633 [Marchantia paleacea]